MKPAHKQCHCELRGESAGAMRSENVWILPSPLKKRAVITGPRQREKKCRKTACNEPQHMPPNHKEQAERALGTVAPPSRFWGPELINNTRKLPRADGPLTQLQARNAGGLNRNVSLQRARIQVAVDKLNVLIRRKKGSSFTHLQ